MTREEWREFPEYPVLLVSDVGRVVSLEDGLLRQRADGDGYPYIYLPVPHRRGFKVHRLVCWTFHGPPPSSKPLALHWDDNPLNNHASNLRWGTYADNYADMVRNGGMYKTVEAGQRRRSDRRALIEQWSLAQQR